MLILICSEKNYDFIKLMYGNFKVIYPECYPHSRSQHEQSSYNGVNDRIKKWRSYKNPDIEW